MSGTDETRAQLRRLVETQAAALREVTAQRDALLAAAAPQRAERWERESFQAAIYRLIAELHYDVQHGTIAPEVAQAELWHARKELLRAMEPRTQ